MKIKVTFHGCEQRSQVYGSPDEHMVSEVFFTIEENGKEHAGLRADIKQTAGANFETGPIEVGWPVGYKGPFNYHEFAKAAQQYYRDLVGASGSLIRIGPGATNIGMAGNRLGKTHVVEFEAREGEDGW